MTTTKGIACVRTLASIFSATSSGTLGFTVPVPSSANGDIPPKVPVIQGLDTGKGSVNTGSVRAVGGIRVIPCHLLIDYLLKTYYVPDTEQELVLRLTRPSRSSPRSCFLTSKAGGQDRTTLKGLPSARDMQALTKEIMNHYMSSLPQAWT